MVPARMDSNDIQCEQARRLCGQIRPLLHYLGRLRRRMELLGFPPDDPLYIDASDAHNALQSLHVRSHYHACPGGVAKPEKFTAETQTARRTI